MFQGVDDTIAWFARTQKTGWRLSQGKYDIADYFDAEATNESAMKRLKEELDYLRGGTYHIDAKNTREEPRKILQTDFIILPKGDNAVSGTRSQHVPGEYISREDMSKIIANEIAIMRLQDQNEKLQQALENAYTPEPTMLDHIGSLLDHPTVKQLAPIVIAKLLGGTQVGIAGTDSEVEPVQTPTQTNQTMEQESDYIELTDIQEERLNKAFDILVPLVGGVNETLDLLECLAPYIQQETAMFNVIKPTLLKYKK